MATILLIEDGPGIGGQLLGLLTTAGHRVLWCGGGPTPLAACPLLRQGRCPLADAAELLVFACPLDLPLRGRSYRGSHLLRAYRAHPDYGRLPLVLMATVAPQDLAGTGPTELVTTVQDPAAVPADGGEWPGDARRGLGIHRHRAVRHDAPPFSDGTSTLILVALLSGSKG